MVTHRNVLEPKRQSMADVQITVGIRRGNHDRKCFSLPCRSKRLRLFPEGVNVGFILVWFINFWQLHLLQHNTLAKLPLPEVRVCIFTRKIGHKNNSFRMKMAHSKTLISVAKTAPQPLFVFATISITQQARSANLSV